MQGSCSNAVALRLSCSADRFDISSSVTNDDVRNFSPRAAAVAAAMKTYTRSYFSRVLFTLIMGCDVTAIVYCNCVKYWPIKAQRVGTVVFSQAEVSQQEEPVEDSATKYATVAVASLSIKHSHLHSFPPSSLVFFIVAMDRLASDLMSISTVKFA